MTLTLDQQAADAYFSANFSKLTDSLLRRFVSAPRAASCPPPYSTPCDTDCQVSPRSRCSRPIWTRDPPRQETSSGNVHDLAAVRGETDA
jgi:hypothetical protein